MRGKDFTPEKDLLELTGSPPLELREIGGGGNSRVFRFGSEALGPCVAKFYFPGARNRLGIEFSSLRFLRERGVSCVPRPLAAAPARGLAVYGFVEGEKPSPGGITPADVANAARFVGRLKELGDGAGEEWPHPASDAHFSMHEAFRGMERRLERLLPRTEPAPLVDFLHGEFLPAMEEIRAWCTAACGDEGFHGALPERERVLSPSDFGFHNTLRSNRGELCFIDFEYFGWDDPAKLICDFLLHPAMGLSPARKRSFVEALLGIFGRGGSLPGRLGRLYPVCGLKWCLIMLNVFVPEDLGRRRFSSGGRLDREGKQEIQLLKARRMLGKVMNEYGKFPFF